MKATIQIEIVVGTSPRESFVEAVRLSNLLHVNVKYKFNYTHVCVNGDRLVYALNDKSEPDEWFIKAIEELTC